MSCREQTAAPPMAQSAYHDGRVLSAAALKVDAKYLATARNRHQSQAHRAGVVAGLHLQVVEIKRAAKGEPDAVAVRDDTRDRGEGYAPRSADVNYRIEITPGAAVDERGRLLLLDTPRSLAIDATASSVAIRLEYAAERVPPCDGTSSLERWEESPKASVAALDAADRCADAPTATSVFLGVCRFAIEKKSWSIDEGDRVYVAAAGAKIDAISGRARVILGPEFPRDSRRFAVGVPTVTGKEFTDVISWETTRSLSTRSPVSISHPQERNSKPIAELQPPIMIVGVPRVCLSAADVVDPCRAWDVIIDEKGPIKKLLSQIRGLREIDLTAPPLGCAWKMTGLIVRILNGLLRRVSDERFAATALPKTPDITPFAALSAVQELFDRYEEKLLRRLFQGRVTAGQRTAASNWRNFPDAPLCRLLLDELFASSIVPLTLAPQRGIEFKDAGPATPEPQPARVHLVTYQQDKQTVRELRITIPDPGEKNHPERYRCSIGQTTECTNQEFDLERNPLNRQTGQPRGVLSILADRSIDLHRDLNVFADPQTLLPGLILKLAPPDSGPAAGGAGASAGGQSGTPTPVLSGAVRWQALDITPRTVVIPQRESVTLTGQLQNLSDRTINSLTLFATLYPQSDTQISPQQTRFVALRPLGANMNVDLKILFGPVSLDLLAVQGKDVVLNLLLLGATENNEIIRTQEQRVLPSV